MKSVIVIFIFFFPGISAFSQNEQKDQCSILKNGSFKYLDIEDTTAYFTINKNGHTEYHRNGKYKIQTKITWIDSCQYKMLMLSSTIPDFPFKPGDIMIVTIEKIEEGIIYYVAEAKGEKWPGRLIKIK